MSRLRHRLAALRQRHRVREFRLLRPLVRRLGYHLVPATFYSPIPDLHALPPETWTEAADMPGVAFDLEAQLAFVAEELASWLAEHPAPDDLPGTDTGFYRRNPNFPGVDAEVLYAMVRRFRPSRVLELGSGFSTLVIDAAAQRNRADGAFLRHEVYDPFPTDVIDPVRGRIDLQAIPATEVPVARLTDLQSGDLLFIDTTHTVKPAGDVVHLLLGALPRIAPGVLIHIHDFYRPFEYPRMLMDVFGSYWQEHYLIQALLSFNTEFEVLCANHALHRLRPEAIGRLVPGLDPLAVPSSLWLRRRAVNLEPSDTVSTGR